MKIAVLYCGTLTAAWSVADGLVTTLQRMGHTVLPLVRGRQETVPVTVELLNHADLVLVSGPEHIFVSEQLTPWRKGELTREEWTTKVKTPKAFWYLESWHREDRNFPFEKLAAYADHHFFAAAQDAEAFDDEHFAKGRSTWLPFGVDTQVFRPTPCPHCLRGLNFTIDAKGAAKETISTITGILKNTTKEEDLPVCKKCLGSGIEPQSPDISVGFVGHVYGKRQAFLNSLGQHLKNFPYLIRVGNVQMQDIDGVPWREQTHRLAWNYKRCAIFLNLPHLSELLVTKIFEVMACGVFLMTPVLTGPGEANCQLFEHTKHLVYYSPSNFPFLVQSMEQFLDDRLKMNQIAANGYYEIKKKHTLEQRLTVILETMFKEKPFTAPAIEAPEIGGINA